MITIEFFSEAMGNDAFHPSPSDEIARILRDLADKIEDKRCPVILRDINGNLCGSVDVDADKINGAW
jgi:hypothetical protein